MLCPTSAQISEPLKYSWQDKRQSNMNKLEYTAALRKFSEERYLG